MKLKPFDDHRISSSAILDKLMPIKLSTDKYSIAKSRLETESIEFRVGEEKFNFFATKFLSIG